MRFLILSFFALFILSSSHLFSQKEPMKFGKVPQEDLDFIVYTPDTLAEAVVLGDYGYVDFQFKEHDVVYRFRRHKRIKILKRSGFSQGDITIPYYSKDKMEEVKSLEGLVITPNGQVTDISKKEIFEEKVNENWSRKRFSCPNLKEGAVIDYRYEIISTAIFQLPEWYFQEDIPVRWSELRLEIPEWYDYVFINQGRLFDINEQGKSDANFYIPGGIRSSGNVNAKVATARFVMKDVPAMKEESYITTMDDYYARMRFQLSAVQYPNRSLEKVMSDWPQTAQKLWNEEKFGVQISNKRNYDKAWESLQPHLAGVTSVEEKIQTIYRFLSSNMSRENGTGLFVRKSLNDCFEKKSARRHELNLMLIALLNEAGVEANPVLVSTRSHGRPMPLYPLLDQFDHVMALVRQDDKNVFLDIVHPSQTMGYPPIESLNSMGWIVHKTNPEWVNIVPSFASDIYLLNLSLTEDGDIDGQLTMSCEGYSAINEREQLFNSPSGDHLKKRFANRFPDSKIDSLVVENRNDLDKPLRIKGLCNLPGLAQISGDYIYIAPPMISDFNENPFKLDKRNYPVDIPYPFKEKLIVNINLPVGYAVEDLPESVRISLPGDAGQFQYQVSQNGSKLQLTFNLQISRLHFEPEDYDSLRNFFSMVEDKLKVQIVLKKTG